MRDCLYVFNYGTVQERLYDTFLHVAVGYDVSVPGMISSMAALTFFFRLYIERTRFSESPESSILDRCTWPSRVGSAPTPEYSGVRWRVSLSFLFLFVMYNISGRMYLKPLWFRYVI